MDYNNEKDIEYILLILAHPELEQTTEFIFWIKEPKNKQLYYELKAAYDAMALKEKSLPDVNQEWVRFKQGKLHKKIENSYQQESKINSLSTSYRIIAIAASICLLAGLSFWGYYRSQPTEPLALMQMNPAPQEVILTNEQGRHIVLSSQTNPDSLAIVGATMDNEKELAYQPATKLSAATTVNQQTLQTPRGKDFKILLSDGTEVWLNAESKLTYPTHFTGESRIVELSGEAYFKVAKDTQHPFIVKTQKLETQVFGTGFNIHAYQYDDPHITLVEGKVAIKSQYYHIMLRPGENAKLNQDGSIKVQKIDTQIYTAWTEGYFYFDNTSLKDIMKELGRWYNLTIQIQNPQVMNYHFNFWANRKDSIEHVIDLINELGKVKASLHNNTLTII